MSLMVKCHAVCIVRSFLRYFYLNKVILKLLWKFFTLIFAILLAWTNFYARRVLYNTYIPFKVQLPMADSTEITAGGPEITLEGPLLLDAR